MGTSSINLDEDDEDDKSGLWMFSGPGLHMSEPKNIRYMTWALP